YKEFNTIEGEGFKKPIKNFRGPYIKSEPEIKIHKLQKNDKYLILATDGLWDFYSAKEVGEIIKQYQDNNREEEDLPYIATSVLYNVLLKAADKARIPYEK